MIFFLIVIAANAVTIATAKPSYLVTVVEIESNVTTANMDIMLEISRPSRGVEAVSGYINFIEDINSDNATLGVNVLYSSNGISYMMTPFCYPSTSLTEGLNVMYKNYLMESMKECCENSLYFEGQFASPLEKLLILCKDCVMKTDNMPSHMRMGFYKTLVFATGEVEFYLMLLLKFERE